MQGLQLMKCFKYCNVGLRRDFGSFVLLQLEFKDALKLGEQLCKTQHVKYGILTISHPLSLAFSFYFSLNMALFSQNKSYFVLVY